MPNNLPSRSDNALPFDVLHLGLPKTGSSYLQMVAMDAHPEINFSWRDHKGLFFELRDYSFEFDRAAFLDKLRAMPFSNAKPAAKKSVFSAEAMSGHAFDGAGARMIIDLLSDLMPGVKAFIVLREQKSYVRSAWNAYVMEGGVLDVKGFLSEHASPAISMNIPRGNFERTGHLNIFEKLCYDRYVAYAQEKFGRENFKVLFFEDLKANRTRFFRDIFEFIGVDPDFEPRQEPVNVSFSEPWRGLYRFANRFCQTQHNEAGILPFSAHLRARQAARLLSSRFPNKRDTTLAQVDRHVPDWAREKWRESNRKLATMFDHDLTSLGYEV